MSPGQVAALLERSAAVLCKQEAKHRCVASSKSVFDPAPFSLEADKAMMSIWQIATFPPCLELCGR